MIEVGLVSSPGYRNRRGGLKKMRSWVDGREQIVHEEVATPEDVAATFRRFEERGIRLVVVNGGDGTLSMVLTDVLRRHPHGTGPHLAVLPGGRTNMSAGDVGLVGSPTRQLDRLLRWVNGSGPDHGVITRPMIGVRARPEAPEYFGMFLGAAIIPKACRGCWDLHASGKLGMGTEFGTFVGVVKLLTRALFGKNPFRPFVVRMRLDGRDLPETEFSSLFATTLERMVFGMTPWWNGERGPLKISAVDHRYRRLFLALVRGVWGHRNRFCNEENGFRSWEGHELEMWLDDAILDGEIIEPDESGPLLVRADRLQSFVVPCSSKTNANPASPDILLPKATPSVSPAPTREAVT